MKKFATILVLLFVLSVSTFADGVVHTGNRTCPQGQTCATDNGTTDSDGLVEDVIRENVLYFLKFIF